MASARSGREVQVRFILIGGTVTGLAVALVSAAGGCGGLESDRSDVGVVAQPPATTSAQPDAKLPGLGEQDSAFPYPDSSEPWCPNQHTVALPEPGVPAAPQTLCTVASPTVVSPESARVTLTNLRFAAGALEADGAIAIPAAVLAQVTTLPTLEFRMGVTKIPVTVSNLTKIASGFQFSLAWAKNTSIYPGELYLAKVVLPLTCEDADARTIEATTVLELCEDHQGGQVWRSSGDNCSICRIIAEMAPSPIVSDNQGDDLPLGRVVQIRVIEVARGGNQVLLLAENDAGHEGEYDWRVSAGTLQTLDSDLVLWTLPDDPEQTPFGQVAVWNPAGAAVENFLWSVA
jgi:hypothetical protein